MKCEDCGAEFDGDGDACPGCGKRGKALPASVGAPGTVGPASANGSDEVRNSDTPKPERVVSGLANPGRPAGQIIEGTGG